MKKMKLWACAIIKVIAITTYTPSLSQTVELPRPAHVNMPFNAESGAQAGFLRYVERVNQSYGKKLVIPPNFFQLAQHVLSWGFEYEQVPKSGVRVSFVQVIDAQPLVDEFLSQLGSYKESRCRLRLKASNPTLVGYSSHSLIGTIGISGEARWCEGGGSGHIANVNGNATVTVNFVNKVVVGLEGDRLRGNFKVSHANAKSRVKAERVIGIDINSVVGQILVGTGNFLELALDFDPTKRVNNLGVNILNHNLWRFDDFQFNASMAINSDATSSLDAYRKFIAAVRDLRWSRTRTFELSDTGSGLKRVKFTGEGIGFEEVKDGRLVLVLRYDTFVASSHNSTNLKNAMDDVAAELTLLRSFPDPEEEHVVRKGDSLINLATKRYQYQHLGYLLASYNGIPASNAGKLNVGTVLKIPPLYALVSIPDVLVVTPGDSVYDICRKRYKMMPLKKCQRELIRMNPGLIPSKIRTIEAIKVPSIIVQ